jgi:hypothetical protein
MGNLAARMLKSSTSRSSVHRYTIEDGNLLADNPNRTNAFYKTSDISYKRIEAGNPMLAQQMFIRFLAQYAQDYKDGLVSTPMPAAWQVWNADEMGLPPHGKHLATFSWGSKMRAFRGTSNEKSTFWVSVLFASRADGGMNIPPMLVHQDGAMHTISGDKIMNLEGNTVVHSTSSGYMDKEGFRAYVQHFAHHVQPQKGHLQYLYIDGHDSHFDHTAMDGALSLHVRVMLLKANDSVNDQPQDNGMNACLKAKYNVRFELFRRRFYSVPFTPFMFNQVFTDAWNDYISDPKLPRTVIKAFAKTGLHPMTDILRISNPQTLQAVSLAEVFVCSDKGKALVSRLKSGETVAGSSASCPIDIEQTDSSSADDEEHAAEQQEGLSDIDESSISDEEDIETTSDPDPAHPAQSRQPSRHVLTYQDLCMKTVISLECVVAPNTNAQVFKLIVDKAVKEDVQTSHIAPIQEIQQLLQEQARFKKLKVNKTAALTCQNPNTTTGLCVTSDMLREMYVVEGNRAAKRKADEERATATSIKRGRTLSHLQETKQQFLTQCQSDPTTWKSTLKAPQLKDVYRSLGGKLSGLKKMEHISAIEALILTGGGDSDSSEDSEDDEEEEDDE